MQFTLHDAAGAPCSTAFERLGTGSQGLSDAEAARRLAHYGGNTLGERRLPGMAILWRQLRNPLLVLLVAAALVSLAVGERNDAYIIVSIIALSVGLGFFNEYRSERAMEDLHARVRHRAIAVRDGRSTSVDVTALVPGDLVELAVGDIVPADLRLYRSDGLECDQAAITGESLPVEKSIEPCDASNSPAGASNCALMGTTVRSGSGAGIVVTTGRATVFGGIAAHLAVHPPETAFQSGLRRFSQFLVRVTAILTVSIFAINAALHHPLFDALLFALAIAVGLTPQLLPAIVTVSLAAGARELAKRQVIVKRLVSIEDLGNIDVLFTDKTGTLTQGDLGLHRWIDAGGLQSDRVLQLALACSDGSLALDRALRDGAAERGKGVAARDPLARLPFDYRRRVMSVVTVFGDGGKTLVVKGAPESVLARCAAPPASAAHLLSELFDAGERVVAVATRPGYDRDTLGPEDECGLTLEGFVSFDDPVKSDAAESLERLRRLGIELRIVTGDNERVARKLCADLGIAVSGTLTGDTIEGLSDAELERAVERTTIFARVSPDQKARLIRLSRAAGKDVGFLGDGVNDAVALHDADVGISVESGTDVAKDAADIVLLDKSLEILADGVVEGRRIFSNTVKYVLMGTSSNFGNMFSAGGASIFLSFLPMTAPQILLNNLLYDVGEMAIPTDRVDEELLAKPAHWDIRFIQRFMLVFGPVSSVFDFATFGVMLFVFHATAPLFQTGWFVESLLTQTLIIFAIRTRRIPFWKSRPSWQLTATSLAVIVAGALLPFTALGRLMGFAPLPPAFFGILLAMIAAYLVLVECAKAYFYRAPRVRAAAVTAERGRRLSRLASRWMHSSQVFHGPDLG